MYQDARTLLCSDPASPICWLSLADLCIDDRGTGQVLNLMHRAILLDPLSAGIAARAGLKAIELKRHDLARTYLAKAVCLDPSRTGCNLDLGLTFDLTNAPSQALHFYRREMTLSPHDPVPYFNSANAFMALGDPVSSSKNYDLAIDLGMIATGVYKSAAIAHLVSGNFSRGWTLYETRFFSGDLKTLNTERALQSSKPLMSQNLAAHSDDVVLVWPEQGVGDEIMFGSMLGEFRGRVGRLFVQMDRRLIPVFKRSLPEDVVFFERGTQVPESLYDAHIAVGSLGQHLRTSLQSFRGHRSRYLRADPARSAAFKEWLGLEDGETAVGISWKSINPETGRSRSISLVDLLSALRGPRQKFVNLQYGQDDGELAAVRDALGIEIVQVPFLDLTDDLDGVAALIEACDEVVSIGNATAHLAGALGRKTTVLLPGLGMRGPGGKVIPGWRWIGEAGKCVWYESVELLRWVEGESDWGGVLSRLRHDRLHRQT